MKTFYVVLAIIVGLIAVQWASWPTYPDSVTAKGHRYFQDIAVNSVFQIGRLLDYFGIVGTEHLIRGFFNVGSVLFKQQSATDFNVNIERSAIGNTPVVIIKPKSEFNTLPGILYFHGGGWLFGSPNTHLLFTAWLSDKANVVIISVDYGLSPETTSKSQIEECVSVTRHVFDHAEAYGMDSKRIIIAGDSAGGNLAGVVSISLINSPYRILANVLLSPGLQAVNFTLPSYKAFRNFFSTPTEFYIAKRAGQSYNSDVKWALRQSQHIDAETLKELNSKYLNVLDIPDYPFPKLPMEQENLYPRVNADPVVLERIAEVALYPAAWPLLADDAQLHRLPQTFIQACEFDFIRDDALLYGHRLRKNSVAVTLSYLNDAFHVEPIYSFYLPPPISATAQKGLEDILKFVKSVV